MTIRFELNDQQIRELTAKMIRLPNRMEKTINSVLHEDGISIATQDITSLIPNSQWKNSALNKQHARTSNWSKSEKFNLGFTIKSRGGAANKRGSFGYLVFPNEGRGPSNPIEQRFMERGLTKATPRILEAISLKIDQVLREELG